LKEREALLQRGEETKKREQIYHRKKEKGKTKWRSTGRGNEDGEMTPCCPPAKSGEGRKKKKKKRLIPAPWIKKKEKGRGRYGTVYQRKEKKKKRMCRHHRKKESRKVAFLSLAEKRGGDGRRI